MSLPVEVGERRPTQFTIVTKKPSQLTAVGFAGYKNLVRDSFVQNGLPIDDLDRIVREEYGGVDGRKIILLGYDGPRLVGAAIFNLFRPDEGERASDFWNELPKEIAERARNFSPLALEIQRILVSPKHYGEKIGAKLLRHALEELRPSIILALTQSPKAVVAGARILGEAGYRTFFGSTEITPGHGQLVAKEYESIRNAYLSAAGLEIKPEGVIRLGVDQLPPRVPEIEGLSVLLKDAFSSIPPEQYRARGTYTVVKPLISVRSEVLEAA